MRRKWLLILMAVAAIGLAFTGYSLFAHSETEYFTIGQVKAQAGSVDGLQTRVAGKVMDGTISWDSASQKLSFALGDGGETLPVVYQGVAPDEFKPGAELIVEGRYSTGAEFEATGFGSRRSVCNVCH